MTIAHQTDESAIDHARRFLDAVFGDHENGYVLTWTAEDKWSRWNHVTALDYVARGAMSLSRGFNVYIGCGLRAEALGERRRGRNDEVIAIPGIWADIDIAGPAHKRPDLPQSLDDARRLVGEFPLYPSIAVDSGHGVQCWWLFREMWYFDTPEEHQQAMRLLKAFTATLNARAAQHGWKIDSADDLSRLLRLPGTMNRKGTPVPVRILALHESRRYNPEDFEPYLVDIETPQFRGGGQHQGKPADINGILQECGWLRHCRDNAAQLGEPDWYAMLSIVGRCDDGENLVRQWSAPYPGYSPEETDKKLVHAVKDAGPRTCSNIQLVGESKYCFACPHRGRITSPIVLGNGWQAVNPYRRPRRLHTPAVPPLTVLRGGTG